MTAHLLVCGEQRVAWRDGRLVDPNDVPDAIAHDLGARRTIVPGFIDAHHHAGLHALYGGTTRLAPPEVTDIPSLQQAVVAESKRTREGWIVVTDWDEERLAERRAPTRQELDDACADRPVLAMHYTCHRAVANAPHVPGIATFPIRSLLARGVVVAGSSDFPCASFDPMLGIHSAMDRLTALGDVCEPDERVSREEAILLYTKNAAIAAGCVTECGTLDLGKRADLVVLEGDEVRTTFLAGEVVFGAL